MIISENQKVSSEYALFNLGFRPFFLGATIFSIFSILLWMGISILDWEINMSGLPAVTWHAHEMIYGYSMAVIAGFLLTAIKNWTGIQTLHGLPLLLLFFLWVTGRVLFFLGDILHIELVAIIDCMFIFFLALSTAIPVIKKKQWMNFTIITKLILLLASNIIFYLGILGIMPDGVYIGLYSGLYLIIALIFMMGRRVIPFFIEKGVDYTVELKNRKWLDISSLILLLLFWVTDLMIPNETPVAILAGLLFILHGTRIVGWYTHGIWGKPLLWVLYLGYLSVIIGFALKAAVVLFNVSPYLSVHAFAFGGIGMITIGMMARVSLGHTGRNIFEPPVALPWIFSLLFIGAIIRVLFPLIDSSHYMLWVGLSQLLWIISFSIFLYIYFSMLIKPRIDGQYG